MFLTFKIFVALWFVVVFVSCLIQKPPLAEAVFYYLILVSLFGSCYLVLVIWFLFFLHLVVFFFKSSLQAPSRKERDVADRFI